MRPSSLLPLALLAALAAPAQAQQSFIARVYPPRVGAGDGFVVEVTLSIEDGRVDGYHPPDFKGARVISEQPSQSTQIQMGGGGSAVQMVYTWHYELQAQQKGTLNFGSARVRVNGREYKTGPASVIVGDATGAAPRPAPQRRSLSPFGGLPFGREPAQASAEDANNFIRVVPSKTKAYVGEQITVEWYIYLVARADKVAPITEPRTDGFWAEDLPMSNAGGIQLAPQTYQNRDYLVAAVMRKALFPLQPGRLTISPTEWEISQVDFFGSTMRTQRLKAEPTIIEVQPLPTAGQPRGFDPAAVGNLSLAAKVDRDRVGVGDAVTLTITIGGQGNVRKLPPPVLGKLDGWKVYDPKISVAMEPGDVVKGTKTIEYLLLPERAGTTTIPAFSMPIFDPAAQSYVVEKTAPIRIEVNGEGAPATPGQPGKKTAAPSGPSGAENVLGIDIRPLHARPSLRRDLGNTFYRSRFFLAVLLAPPLLFGLTGLVGRIRERLSQDTEGARRRRLRRLVRRRLGAAEKHLEAGRTGPFFIEIDRVLREFLSGKLGRPVTGLSRDELRAQLAAAGSPDELTDRTLAALEECDRARFAPGTDSEAEMRAALDRAGDVILQIERAKLRPEVA
jgi:hypothetical protein